LDEVFAEIPKHVPISVDIKDNTDEALLSVINLIKKHDRFRTTLLATESGTLMNKATKAEPRICCVFDKIDVIFLIFSWFFGLFPFIRFDREMAALPYMTRDFIKMKYVERD
jgi:hypothetical protein